MKLHKEGTVTLILEILVFSLSNYLAYTYANKYIACFTTIITGFLFIMTLYFFRIPKRELKEKKELFMLLVMEK